MRPALMWLTAYSVLIICLFAPVRAFAYKVSSENGVDIKWYLNAIDYRHNIDGGPAGTLQALQSAMNTWTAVSSTSFSFFDAGYGDRPFGKLDYVNIFDFGPLQEADTIALSQKWYLTGNLQTVDNDIRFNTAFNWSTTGSPAAYDVQSVATHELGHSVGLADLYDDFDTDKMMYGYMSIGELRRYLNQDDVNGISYLYPPGPGMRASASAEGVYNTCGANVTIKIFSSGNSSLYINGAWITEENGGSFSFSPSEDYCSGRSISPGSSCTMTLLVEPSTTGQFSTSFLISSSAADVYYAFEGTGAYGCSGANSPPEPSVLYYPADMAYIDSTSVDLSFSRSHDPEGDYMDYIIYVSRDASFETAYPIYLTSLEKPKDTLYANKGGAAAALMLMGLTLAAGTKKRKLALFLAVLVVLSIGFALTSCGGGGGGGSSNTGGSTMYYTAGGLESGSTYYWMVQTVDSEGATALSEPRSFTVQ